MYTNVIQSRWLELCLSEFLKLDILSEISICFPLRAYCGFNSFLTTGIFQCPRFSLSDFCTLRWECHVCLVSLIFSPRLVTVSLLALSVTKENGPQE